MKPSLDLEIDQFSVALLTLYSHCTMLAGNKLFDVALKLVGLPTKQVEGGWSNVVLGGRIRNDQDQDQERKMGFYLDTIVALVWTFPGRIFSPQVIRGAALLQTTVINAIIIACLITWLIKRVNPTENT